MVANHPMIELRRLHRFFGKTKAVNDVSFEVPRGTVFGYIGPNGAGKTTSMRILASLELPTYGDAFVDGFSVINDPDRVRRRLGFMPDYFGTYADVNVEEYLDFFARSYGLIGRERHQRLQYVMHFTGLDVLKEKPIRGLSKGMKQRLCLGRAMVHDPAVLILDEPANGLDPRARIELREMIRELAARGTTVLVSSHILTELAEMCDRVAILERGQLLALGTVAEIQKQQQPQREVNVGVLGDPTSLLQWLTVRTDVADVRLNAHSIRFAHQGERESEAALLREMLQAGFAVCEFGSHNRSLEDVFLAVTKGLVQ
ncbi:putative ABC transporter ATP-binding protein YbhF [Anatilimnocola aggregata]|uniref:Putative ABC transporter ATP-binding protein YbhF n=1 Tax=Anatilimnocola aggregata TaxID=2528021 RepID=A0A517Y675_9BACT|nr:ABC transporter ATP-binding protein [Anatilimnocola aggregata]QDU25716.1 putative ABC transporter ATP-binding protein YbhF [Anatilimnocola aggregata]